MKKSELKKMPEYFADYINLITDDIDLSEALEKYGPGLYLRDKNEIERAGDKVYAAGKWTVKDILQHLIDSERIFNYRALTIARKDETKIPGFDENFYAEKTNAGKRSLNDLLDEYEIVRKSSLMLFKSFNDEMLLTEGIANNKNISVLALGFAIAGHSIHHYNVIKERYYSL